MERAAGENVGSDRGPVAGLYGSSWSLSLYVLAIAAVSLVCISLLSETYLTDLSEIRGRLER